MLSRANGLSGASSRVAAPRTLRQHHPHLRLSCLRRRNQPLPSGLSVAAKGSERQLSGSDTGTVSRWPFIAMTGPLLASPARTTRFGLAGSLLYSCTAIPWSAHHSRGPYHRQLIAANARNRDQLTCNLDQFRSIYPFTPRIQPSFPPFYRSHGTYRNCPRIVYVCLVGKSPQIYRCRETLCAIPSLQEAMVKAPGLIEINSGRMTTN